jgi:putative ABC transport system permease protein
VKDSKYRTPSEDPTPFFYGSFEQMFWSGHTHLFYVRTSEMSNAAEILRREVAALGAQPGLYETASLTDYTQWALFGERITAGLMSALGLLALVMAAAGFYSMMAYTVTERTQEVGIRLALGATRGSVVGMVLGRGVAMTVAGLLFGNAGAIAGVRILGSALDLPVTLAEPSVFAAVALLLLLVALLACAGPASRISKLDPVLSLRFE